MLETGTFFHQYLQDWDDYLRWFLSYLDGGLNSANGTVESVPHKNAFPWSPPLEEITKSTYRLISTKKVIRKKRMAHNTNRMQRFWNAYRIFVRKKLKFMSSINESAALPSIDIKTFVQCEYLSPTRAHVWCIKRVRIWMTWTWSFLETWRNASPFSPFSWLLLRSSRRRSPNKSLL